MNVEPFPEVKMASMCDTCAYRSGSIANLDVFTQMKREICENLGASFLCHANRDLSGELIPGEPPALCAGFVIEFQKRLNSGFYERQSPEEKERWRKASEVADYIAESIAEAQLPARKETE